MNQIDTSNELVFYRYNMGIKLLRPDEMLQGFLPGSSITTHAVTRILNIPFPIYFENTDHIAKLCNENTVEACGFESFKECLKKEWFKTFKKDSVLPLIANDKKVVKENKFTITEEYALRKDDVPIHGLSIRWIWLDFII